MPNNQSHVTIYSWLTPHATRFEFKLTIMAIHQYANLINYMMNIILWNSNH